MHHALYRKYRPKTFADVFGQDAITSALKNQIASGKIGHAYIFTGTRGTGKTTCAKIFARAVNCLHPANGEPCGECEICKGLENGSILDVVEIDAASNNGVDDIRDLRDEAAYTPANCKYKVYIVDEVHMLSTSAFNALLKIMEEPPAHVIFILATTEIHKVPATVLSRCQRYDFGRIPPQVIAERLRLVAEQEHIALTDAACALIARLADGALRDALSILDTCASSTEGEVDEELVRRMAGVTDKSYLFSLSDAVAGKDATRAVLLLSELREKAIDMKRLCTELIHHYRSILLAGAGADQIDQADGPEQAARYREAAAQISMADAVFAMRALGDCLDRMSRGTDPRIELELCLFHLCGLCAPAAVPAPSARAALPKPAPIYAPYSPEPAPQSALPDSPPWETGLPAPLLPENTPAAAPAAPVVPTAPAPADTAAGEIAPCPFWPQVVAAAKQSDPMLYGFLTSSKAYLKDKRVLIDGSPLFLSFMRANRDSSARIKKLIEQVTGESYVLGPYEKKAGPAAPSKAEQTLQMLKDSGVPVQID